MIKIQNNKYIFWGIVITTLTICMTFLAQALQPFVISFILSYLFVPIVDAGEKRRFNRGVVSAIIVLFWFIIFFSLVMILVPFLYTKSLDAIKFISYDEAYLNQQKIKRIAQFVNIDYELSKGIIKKVIQWTHDITVDFMKINSKGIISSVPYYIAVIFVMPIISFYMMKDWYKMLDSFDSLIPLSLRRTTERLAKQIDTSIFAYLRGQLNVALFFATYYSVMFTTVGLNLGFLIGLAMGLVMFIPYVGFFVGFCICSTIAFLQFGSSYQLMVVFIMFTVGQLMDANYVTPKFVGDKIGLHPVIIVFGLFASSITFGFTGAILALPITTIVAIIIIYFVRKYKKTVYFRG